MEVIELVPGTRVRWLVLEGPHEWIGTTMMASFETQPVATCGWAGPAGHT